MWLAWLWRKILVLCSGLQKQGNPWGIQHRSELDRSVWLWDAHLQILACNLGSVQITKKCALCKHRRCKTIARKPWQLLFTCKMFPTELVLVTFWEGNHNCRTDVRMELVNGACLREHREGREMRRKGRRLDVCASSPIRGADYRGLTRSAHRFTHFRWQQVQAPAFDERGRAPGTWLKFLNFQNSHSKLVKYFATGAKVPEWESSLSCEESQDKKENSDWLDMVSQGLHAGTVLTISHAEP